MRINSLPKGRRAATLSPELWCITHGILHGLPLLETLRCLNLVKHRNLVPYRIHQSLRYKCTANPFFNVAFQKGKAAYSAPTNPFGTLNCKVLFWAGPWVWLKFYLVKGKKIDNEQWLFKGRLKVEVRGKFNQKLKRSIVSSKDNIGNKHGWHIPDYTTSIPFHHM